MPLVGTAGHVSHGKSALLEKLTGKNPMHLKQEREREMTVELGFVSLPSNEGPVGLIDVPGHERYIRQMMSALWALDMVLFVIALDDGVRPMTLVHLDLIRARKIPTILWVFTKKDLFPPDAVQKRVEEIFSQELKFDEIPERVFPVSNLTGEGLEALTRAILREISRLPVAPLSFPQVFVDRVFSLKGQGTVATGSLRGGILRVGDEWVLYPSREHVKIRTLQSYHQEKQSVFPSSRVAFSLRQKVPLRRGNLLAQRDGILCGQFWVFYLDKIPRVLVPSRGKGVEIELVLGGNSSLGIVKFCGSSWIFVHTRESLASAEGEIALFVSPGGTILHAVGRVLDTFAQKKLSSQQRRLLETFDSEEKADFLSVWRIARKKWETEEEKSQSGGLLERPQEVSLRRVWEKKLLDFAQSQRIFSLQSLPVNWRRKTVLKGLVQSGNLRYLGEDFYAEVHQYEALQNYLLSRWKPGEAFDIAAAKTCLDLSRKPLLVFLNKLEREGVLQRVGDLRVVRKGTEE